MSRPTEEEDSWIDAIVYLAKASKIVLGCDCQTAVQDVFDNMHRRISEKIAAIRPEEVEDDPPGGCDEITFRKHLFDGGYEAGLAEGIACALKWHLRSEARTIETN